MGENRGEHSGARMRAVKGSRGEPLAARTEHAALDYQAQETHDGTPEAESTSPAPIDGKEGCAGGRCPGVCGAPTHRQEVSPQSRGAELRYPGARQDAGGVKDLECMTVRAKM